MDVIAFRFYRSSALYHGIEIEERRHAQTVHRVRWLIFSNKEAEAPLSTMYLATTIFQIYARTTVKSLWGPDFVGSPFERDHGLSNLGCLESCSLLSVEVTFGLVTKCSSIVLSSLPSRLQYGVKLMTTLCVPATRVWASCSTHRQRKEDLLPCGGVFSSGLHEDFPGDVYFTHGDFLQWVGPTTGLLTVASSGHRGIAGSHQLEIPGPTCWLPIPLLSSQSIPFILAAESNSSSEIKDVLGHPACISESADPAERVYNQPWFFEFSSQAEESIAESASHRILQLGHFMYFNLWESWLTRDLTGLTNLSCPPSLRVSSCGPLFCVHRMPAHPANFSCQIYGSLHDTCGIDKTLSDMRFPCFNESTKPMDQNTYNKCDRNPEEPHTAATNKNSKKQQDKDFHGGLTLALIQYKTWIKQGILKREMNSLRRPEERKRESPG
uniref:Uncharacterized protein n=1 Tax=Cannabis sativa TaxID=3483 RepID=A0A803QSR0_CANSA